jgi:hypothetical protein
VLRPQGPGEQRQSRGSRQYCPVNHLGWIAASVREIATVKNNVGLLLTQVGEHGIKGCEISVNVRDDGDTHGV